MVNEHREKDVRAAANTASNNKCVAFDGVPGRLVPIVLSRGTCP